MDITQLRTIARQLADGLAAYQPPAPTPPAPPAPTPAPVPSKVVLRIDPGARTGATDLATLSAMFPFAAGRQGKPQGMWASPSAALQILAPGRFRANMVRANWSANPNAAIPLDRPVTAARISYTARIGTGGLPWHWGRSGKLPGLARHAEGWFPGGGRIGPRNFSTCPAWTMRGSQVGIGPYIYGQHRRPVAQSAWAPDYATGTLRWAAPAIEGLAAGGEWRFELDHYPTDDGRQSQTVWRVNGRVVWSDTITLLGPDQPHTVTHCHFRIMYGGNTVDFWPPASVPATVIELDDFAVTEL